jgi:hypothetical protein
MREIRQSGSEGGVGQTNASSLPLFDPKEQRISAKGKPLKRVAALVYHARNIMRSEGMPHRVMLALCGVPSGRNVFWGDLGPMVSPWADMNRPVRTVSVESDATTHGFNGG